MVSVCIPTYNNERFIAETLESVIFQSYVDFEVLVVDDCSSDRTLEIAQIYESRDPRIRVLKNTTNLGMVPNWNRCLELANGTYIKYLFGDDLLASPDALTKMVAAMEGTPGAVLVSCARTIIDEQSRAIDELAHYPDGFTVDGYEIIRHCFMGITRDHNLIGEPSAVMFRRDSAGRGFDLRYRQLVDLEMWFHLLEQGKFVYISEPLCSFRHHEGQQTKTNVSELNFIDDLFYLFNDYLAKPYVGVGRFARIYLMYYNFYKLLKHSRQGKYDLLCVNEKIDKLYGKWMFIFLRPFYRLYTPYWQLKRKLLMKFPKQ